MSAAVLTGACHRRQQPESSNHDIEASSEPEEYSATLVRIIDDGKESAPGITREARSGEKRREEWIENGHNRALIWRPDLGKGYLLDLDERLYVDLEITPNLASEAHAEAGNLNGGNARTDSTDSLVQAVDRAIDDAPMPDDVEVRTLPTVVIDGHSCEVYEHRASFPDGHIEITRLFRASDLVGLPLRIESESAPARTKVTTERRDVRLAVSPDAFVVPADFKKVDRLAP
jgi:hypothetical protein